MNKQLSGFIFTSLDNTLVASDDVKTKLPVTGGTDTYIMTSEGKGNYNDWQRWQFNVVLYNSADEVITPTAGDIQIRAAQDESLIWRNIVGGDIVATDVYDDVASTSIPYIVGSIYAYKVSFVLVTGLDISYAKVIAVAQK